MATDGSYASRRADEQAVRLDGVLGAKLFILTVRRRANANPTNDKEPAMNDSAQDPKTKNPKTGDLAGGWSVSRRRFLKGAAVAALAAPLGLGLTNCGGDKDASGEAPTEGAVSEAASRKRPASAEAALRRLMEGNRRYAAGEARGLDGSPKRRREIAEEQSPFAVVLACSDSRVPPELLFDEGLGDLFVVRVAGNVVDDAVLGSIEYAVGELGTFLVMVLGHERCGAVSAAVEEAEEGAAPPAHVISLVDPILPAAEEARRRPGDLVDNTVRANVALSRERIRSSLPVLGPAVDRGDLGVVGAYYDLEDGRVVLT